MGRIREWIFEKFFGIPYEYYYTMYTRFERLMQKAAEAVELNDRTIEINADLIKINEDLMKENKRLWDAFIEKAVIGGADETPTDKNF